MWLTPHASTAMLIRRGRRVADYLNSECTALFIVKDVGMSELNAEQRAAVDRHVNFCKNLRIPVEVITSDEPAKAIANWSREHGVTQIFVTRDAPEVQKLVHLSKDMQVTVVSPRVRGE